VDIHRGLFAFLKPTREEGEEKRWLDLFFSQRQTIDDAHSVRWILASSSCPGEALLQLGHLHSRGGCVILLWQSV